MARVFVSYSSRDGALADEVNGWLVEAGHETFRDRDLSDGIVVGDEWDERLHERLRWADALVCVVTSAYIESTWCTGEVAIARSRGCRLIPIMAEPDARHPFLSTVQHAALHDGPGIARAAVDEALRRVDAAGGSGWPDARSPFPGLRAFDTDQHRAFFGRGAEANELAELLRSPAQRADPAVLLVVGPSGCGKSSLVRAGLVPRMAEEPGWWTLPAVTPGADPVGSLVRELAGALDAVGVTMTMAEAHARVAEDGLVALVDELLHAAPTPRRRRLLVVIDQFEQLLTQTPAGQRERFAELIRPALDGPAQFVATFRPEFLDQLLTSSELIGLGTRTFTLRPLLTEMLPLVIEEPARLAGMEVSEELVGRLVADTGGGEALPLLAYALTQLAEGVGRGGQLSMARYEDIGGVQGALTRQADAALAQAVTTSGRSPEQVVRGLLRLVTVDERGRPTRWRVPMVELSAALTAELDPFVARRLLTTDIDNGVAVVEVAHEAFLTGWAPLARAAADNTVALRARRAAEQAAAEWDEAGAPAERLWERGQLASVLADTGARFAVAEPRRAAVTGTADPNSPAWPRRRRVLITEKVTLSPAAQRFLELSVQRDRRRRARSTTVLASLLALAVLAAGVAVLQLHSAEQRQRLATARLLMTQAEATVSTDPRTALQLGEAAWHLNPSPEIRSALAQMVRGTHYGGTIQGQNTLVRSVAVAPDQDTMITAGNDRTAILWDLADPTRPVPIGSPLTGHTDAISSVAFSPDGKIVATAGWDRIVILWDVSDRARPRRIGSPLDGHTDAVYSVTFAPNGTTLATAGRDETVILWSLSDPQRPERIGQPLTDHTDSVSSVVFSPDGHLLAASSWDKTVLLWDVGDPARPRRTGQPITGHTDAVFAVAFAPDGRTLATASWDETVQLWDITDAAQPLRIGRPLDGHSESVFALGFSPDGRMLATAGGDKRVILWSVSDLARPVGEPLVAHSDSVYSLAFTPSGDSLVTAGRDGTVILWTLRNPSQPSVIGEPLTGHTAEVNAVAFSPDGHTMATAGDDNTVLLWDVTDPAGARRTGEPLTGHTAAVNAVAFSPDGHTMATAGDDNTVLLWDVTDPVSPQRVGHPLTGYSNFVQSLTFSADGQILATASFSKSIVLWDLSTPARPRRIPPLIGHTDFVNAVAFAPNGRTLASAGVDRAVVLWDLTAPDRPRRVGRPLGGHSRAVRSLAFAPDGLTLATAGFDNTMILWDLTDPGHPRQVGQPFNPHARAIGSVAFSTDGRTVATTGDDGAVMIMDLSVSNAIRDHTLERACTISRGGLDVDGWARSVPGLPYEDACAAV
ncbi:MAG TPA: TIR domain-containing protein [Pseudonocardia sp.]|nr:TIR domain-containing protein [Pseudonocardia sp.]